MIEFLAALFLFIAQYNHPLKDISGSYVTTQELLLVNQAGLRLDNPLLGASVGIVDKLYFAPDPSEIQKILSVAVSGMTYTAEVYDCDDYSYWFKGELQRQWRKAGHIAPLPIIQVFAIIRVDKTGQTFGHAFNGIVDSTGHIVWIEPQSNKVMNKGKFSFVRLFAVWI